MAPAVVDKISKLGASAPKARRFHVVDQRVRRELLRIIEFHCTSRVADSFVLDFFGSTAPRNAQGSDDVNFEDRQYTVETPTKVGISVEVL